MLTTWISPSEGHPPCIEDLKDWPTHESEFIIIICSITCILFVKVYVTDYSDEDDEMDDSVVVLDEEEDEDEDEDLDQG